MFETPLTPRTAPVLDDDVPWEQYRELDPVGAAQAEAEWWALRQRLDPVTWEPLTEGPEATRDAGSTSGERCGETEEYVPPAGTAAIASKVADLHGPELAGFLDGLPPREGVDGASVIEAIVGFEKVIRWAQAMQLRWVGELASRREDGRTGWARDAGATASAGISAARASGNGGRVDEAVQTDPGTLRTPGEDLVGRVGEHAAAEVAFALHTTRRAATDLLYAAVTLTRRLPETLRAVERGDVSMRAAAVAAEETCVLDAVAVAAVDEVLTERLPGTTVPQARAKVRRAVLSADSRAGAAREAKARRCRSFDVTRQVVDGMGTFTGYLPIEQLVAIDERVDALARAAKAPGDPRSAGARRMDVVVDLLLGRPVTSPDGTVHTEPLPGRVWKVDVVVSEATLRGADDEPGELMGYGPVTAPTARRLAGVPVRELDGGRFPRPRLSGDDTIAEGPPNAEPPGWTGSSAQGSQPDEPSPPGPSSPPGAQPRRDGQSPPDGEGPPNGEGPPDRQSPPVQPIAADEPSPRCDQGPHAPLRAVWRRLVTDPLSGIVRDYGTTRYRPPAALADLVRARDRYCYAPGCRQVAARCDLDHLKNSPAGPSPRPDADGVTADRNVGPGCKYHHRVKARPGWQVTSPTPGTYLWTTPTGHTYRRDAEPPLDAPVYEPPF
jgi:hypothetical protein